MKRAILAFIAAGALAQADYLFDATVLNAIRHAECDVVDGKCHPYTIRLNRKSDRKKAEELGYECKGALLRFASANEAESAAKRLTEYGVDNMDMGPYQINYHYNPAPLNIYFDERLSRAFATLILKRLVDKYGYSWTTLGRYHSSTAAINRSYYLKLHNFIYKENRQ